MVDAAVVGGGPAGIAAALALAREGLSVVLVERSGRLGGRAGELACMATTRCRRCSACLVRDAAAELGRETGIRVVLGAAVTGASRSRDAVEISLERGESLAARSAVLCTGFEPFDARAKPFLGYGRLAGVVTTLELDRVLAASGDRGWSEGGEAPRRVAFVQCVGSREGKEGRGYCSQVCCAVSLRLAGKLLHLHEGMEITIFYIDLQLLARSVRSYHEEIRSRIRFVQGVPGEIEAAVEGGLVVRHEDTGSGTASTFDRVVLGVGMVPAGPTSDLASQLGLGAGSYGFASAGVAPVVAAGACTFPRDIPGSMDDGRAAAIALARALEAGHG